MIYLFHTAILQDRLQNTAVDQAIQRSRNVGQNQFVTRSRKRGLKSLGPIRAAGKYVRDNHYVVSHTTAHLLLI